MKTSTQTRLERRNLSVASEKVIFFLLSHGIANKAVITPDKIITQVQNEKEKMEYFGINTEMLLSLAYCFKKGIAQSYSKEKLSLVIYRYLIYLEMSEVVTNTNIIGWLATIRAPFQFVFNFPTTPPQPATISRLIMQKCMLSIVLKDTMAKTAEQNFTTAMVDWARKIKKQFKSATSNFDLVGFTPVDLKELVGCFIQDISILNKTGKVDTVAAKDAFFVDGLNTTAIVQVVSKYSDFFAEEAGCSREKMNEWISEYQTSESEIDFNINNDSTIEDVFENWRNNSITPIEILDMGKFSKVMNILNAGSISWQ